MNASFQEFQIFILILSRVATLFLVAPVFSSLSIPTQLKVGFSILLALLLFPMVKAAAIPSDLWMYALMVGRELLLGAILGSITYFVFVGVQLAGQIIDLQVGFGIANVIDPLNSAQISVIGQFNYLLALLIFLGVNAHHVLIRAVASSFSIVPLGQFVYSGLLTQGIFTLAGKFFLVALQIGGPVILVLFLTNLTLGILSRTIPQMNVLMVGLPLSVLVGLVFLIISMPLFSSFFQVLLGQMWGDLNFIMARMH